MMQLNFKLTLLSLVVLIAFLISHHADAMVIFRPVPHMIVEEPVFIHRRPVVVFGKRESDEIENKTDTTISTVNNTEHIDTKRQIEGVVIERPLRPFRPFVVERPIIERPIIERPIFERPIIERPIIERPFFEHHHNRPIEVESVRTFRTFGFAKREEESENNLSKEEDTINATNTTTNTTTNSTLRHHIVKRQYFKPSIDGTWLANDRTVLLNKKSPPPPTADEQVVSTVATSTSAATDNCNCTNGSEKMFNGVKVTVNSLALSLIHLFDRVKDTLTNLIKA